ncbi:hypothetical protein F5Y17DRAFT_441969 [Xylariaceae sp. FL0594]|nr:hypothetical protein F5Y17DRAFT_441969 [Xylariaceae sp. FL0594]
MIPTQSIPRESIDGRQAVTEAAAHRVVPKPVPASQSQDPRKYQLDQLKRRFSPKLGTLQNGTTTLRFQLKPSDPDFPFELESLDCEVHVPASYPKEPPTLSVKNKDIPRGFCINVERGWDKLVTERKGTTLLALTQALDKHLEAFLSEQKAETITLVTFKDTRHVDQSAKPLRDASAAVPQPAPKAPAVAVTPKPETLRRYVPEESFTEEQIAAAKARRAQEVRQLEARMGRMPHYQKSADGVIYTLPLEPKRWTELPKALQPVQSVQLIIPLLYPLQKLRILLNDVESEDAEPLEEAFAARAAQQSQLSLMSHLNYLSQNIHIMAKQVVKPDKPKQDIPIPPDLRSASETSPTSNAPAVGTTPVTNREDGKEHIHVIPRPPEWSYTRQDSDSDDSDFSDSETDTDSGDGGADVGTHHTHVSGAVQQVEKGTAVSFPTIELYSIELLQISILNISTKCQRCKTLNDVTNLRPEVEKSITCKKCGTPISATFRPEMVHQNSTRAGFIDITGATLADLLPSTFVPTCSKCSTPSHGLVSVRGDTVTNVCRECHGRFTFKIPQVKFLAITPGSTKLPPTSGPKRKNEKLGLHAGEPLPGRGTCAHYRRSYRWFRFSCCGRVHPCDQCHDAAEDHAQEWANRMICGFCSREQNYAVEACAFCGRSVIGKKGKGFWEGGKGTRDRVRMSRKDKRKYRRVGGNEGKKKE